MLSRPEGNSWSAGATAGYAAACLLLVAAFDGSWLVSDRVGILDWPKELFYFHFLQSSLTQYGQLPVSFFTVPESLRHFSTLQDLSWWSNPEVMSLSPFLPLLMVLPVAWFLKAYFGLHFLMGIAGTGLLARRLGFSPAEGVCLFLLVALNPWLAQHLAIGYTPYINFLLFPGVAALLLAPPRSPWQTSLAALGCAMAFYQGALHLFVWFNLGALLVGLAAGIRTRSARPLIRVLWMQALTFVLIYPKYRAIAWAYADFVRSPGTGYASLPALWGLVTDTASPLFDFPATYGRYGVAFYDASLGVGYWFVALFGAALVLWPFLRRPLPGSGPAEPGLPPWIPALCCAAFLALGWGDNWRQVTRAVPQLASEIYPFRWLFPAYLFAAVFTLAVLVRAAKERGPGLRTALVILLLACAVSLHQRNRVFAEVLVSEEDVYEGFSLREHLTHRVTGLSGKTLLPATASPSGLTLVPPGSEGDVVLLPWLEPWRLREYEYENLRPEVFQPESSTAMTVTASMSPVRVAARAHRRGPLGAVSAGLFLGLAGLSAFAAGRGRGRTSSLS